MTFGYPEECDLWISRRRYEARSTAFYMTLHATGEGRPPTVLAPVEISPDGPVVLSDGASMEVTLF